MLPNSGHSRRSATGRSETSQDDRQQFGGGTAAPGHQRALDVAMVLPLSSHSLFRIRWARPPDQIRNRVTAASDRVGARNSELRIVRLRAVALSTIAIVTFLTSCDSGSPSRVSPLANGWVTNCVGPAFNRFAKDGKPGPGPNQPVFRINDQLVLAVPTDNRPYADKIERQPRECRKTTDLPPAHFLRFVIVGNWSAGYRPEDIPPEDGHKQFDPDYVNVRIEPAINAPSTWTPEEEREAEQTLAKSMQDNYTGTTEIGGMTCFVPKPGVGAFSCSGRRSKSDPDVIKLGFMGHAAPHFVLIQAQYVSSRYGGLQVYWDAWTTDPPIHALDIDAAIWKSIEDWNLGNST
jgi:hypothetical protein